MENTIANIRILDVVRLVHGYFIFVFLIINMLWIGKRQVAFLNKCVCFKSFRKTG
jgi:hypothetical protein